MFQNSSMKTQFNTKTTCVILKKLTKLFTKTLRLKWAYSVNKLEIQLRTQKSEPVKSTWKHPCWTTEREERARKGPVINSAPHSWRQSDLKKKKKTYSFFIDALIKFASNRRFSHSHLSGLSPASLVSTLSIIVILICPPSLVCSHDTNKSATVKHWDNRSVFHQGDR